MVMLGSEVVMAIGDDGPQTAVLELARGLSDRLEVPHRSLHIEEADQDMAAAISAELADDSILVMQSTRIDAWSGKWSVTEHVIDQWGGLVVAAGPSALDEVNLGPVLVAFDGSESSMRGLEVAPLLDGLHDGSVLVCQVLPTNRASEADQMVIDLADDVRRRHGEGFEVIVVLGNSAVTTLTKVAIDRGCSLIVLAARGDRTTTRASMSRTSSGVLADARTPVVIVGHRWGHRHSGAVT